jgi:hypothetical protein
MFLELLEWLHVFFVSFEDHSGEVRCSVGGNQSSIPTGRALKIGGELEEGLGARTSQCAVTYAPAISRAAHVHTLHLASRRNISWKPQC